MAPVPMACQLVPGLALTGPPPIKLVPVHLPDRDLAGGLVLQQDVGRAVLVEIAGPDRLPAGPGLGLTGPPPIKLFPFISQIETWPVLAFCHRMSDWPSSLKSPVPTAFQAGPGLGLTGPAADQSVPVHFPDRGLAGVRVLPQDVGMAVVIEIAGSDRVPGRSGIGVHGPAAEQGVPVHLPDRGLAGVRRSATGCRNGRRH